MSLKVKETIHIQRPVKDVFAFAGADENDALWRELRIFGRRLESLARIEDQRLFEADEEGTRFTYDLSVNLGPSFRLVSPLLARRFRKQVNAGLRRLKRLLEEGNAWRDTG